MLSKSFDRRQLLNDQEEATRLAQEGHQSMIWTALPGIIVDVDLAKMTASVQPTIQGLVANENGTTSSVNLPVLIHVPIIYPSAGGFTITFPLAAGDEVLVIFSSRCIDSWWQSGGVQVQAEMRMHDLSDGFLIPGPKSQPKVISNVSSSNLQIRTNSGANYIELTPSGDINIVGNVNVTGTIVASGEITGGATAIPLSTHHHSGVVPGGGTSGPPVP